MGVAPPGALASEAPVVAGSSQDYTVTITLTGAHPDGLAALAMALGGLALRRKSRRLR